MFPILAVAFFIIPYLPFIGRLKFITELLRKAAAVYTAVLAPGYETFKTLEHRERTDPDKMLSYWLVLALAYVANGTLGMFVLDDFFALIFYLTALGITIWDYFFAKMIYRIILSPMINMIRSKYGVITPGRNIKPQ